MKTVVGIVTFGNLDFTRLAIESIEKTAVENDIDFIVVVGKPGDTATTNYLLEKGIPHIVHGINWGFPKSINDIYDYAWKDNDYDYLILAGNDIVVLPKTIDAIINIAKTSEYEVISALSFDVRSLTQLYPETKKYFTGSNMVFTDFSATPWEALKNHHSDDLYSLGLCDIQNLCLYKKSAFDKVGYTDVAFFPAYFVDNDYANRLAMSKVKGCTLNSKFLHFWSRTIHQGSGGSTSHHFENNKRYYREKWGGEVGKETRTPPLKIGDRENEEVIISSWRNK